jgi:hypothetical protein
MADAGVKEGKSEPQNRGTMMKTLSKGGSFNKMAGTMMDQFTVTVSAEQDGRTEEKMQQIDAPIGTGVNGALHPEDHNAQDVIQVGNQLPGVGWAFATNVASINSMGMSIRGRLLHAAKGPWPVTVSATVSPDPGAAKLDKELGDVARAPFTKQG